MYDYKQYVFDVQWQFTMDKLNYGVRNARAVTGDEKTWQHASSSALQINTIRCHNTMRINSKVSLGSIPVE